ncbi:PREDICTED: uncharacterized protein LOC108687395 [Atta colombica]|uniref:uncharacterized protein LOC108687395 n=1 Tax=Atta colombica TaxID=520822 RepID=UPI00084C845A|nr:PREDICTED: uncharacterized protein LOC108687395 [Atta colombica]
MPQAANKICTVYGAVAERTVRKWFARFKAGDFNLEDQERPGERHNSPKSMAFDASYKDKEELVLRDESVYLEEDVEHANRERLQGEQMERVDQNVKEIVIISRQIS